MSRRPGERCSQGEVEPEEAEPGVMDSGGRQNQGSFQPALRLGSRISL